MGDQVERKLKQLAAKKNINSYLHTLGIRSSEMLPRVGNGKALPSTCLGHNFIGAALYLATPSLQPDDVLKSHAMQR